MSLLLKNPHSVLAVLETRPRDVLEIFVAEKSPTPAWQRVVEVARQKGISVSTKVRKNLPMPAKHLGPPGDDQSRRAGAEASVRERQPISAEELFREASGKAEGKGLWLALDSLQDPQNVGAIFRAAAFFGVQGILLTQERSASLTSSVYDVASGGIEYTPFAIETNLRQALETAKNSGLWILGTSEHAKDDLSSVSSDRPWLLVLGNEERGMRRLTQESCDVLCKISGQGKVTSLNVSVAAGILISRLTLTSGKRFIQGT